MTIMMMNIGQMNITRRRGGPSSILLYLQMPLLPSLLIYLLLVRVAYVALL